MFAVVEKRGAVARKAFCDSGRHPDPGFPRAFASAFREATRTFRIGLIPGDSELLSYAMGDEEGLIGREQIMKAPLVIDTGIVVVRQEGESDALEGILGKSVEFPSLLSRSS